MVFQLALRSRGDSDSPQSHAALLAGGGFGIRILGEVGVLSLEGNPARIHRAEDA